MSSLNGYCLPHIQQDKWVSIEGRLPLDIRGQRIAFGVQRSAIANRVANSNPPRPAPQDLKTLIPASEYHHKLDGAITEPGQPSGRGASWQPRCNGEDPLGISCKNCTRDERWWGRTYRQA